MSDLTFFYDSKCHLAAKETATGRVLSDKELFAHLNENRLKNQNHRPMSEFSKQQWDDKLEKQGWLS